MPRDGAERNREMPSRRLRTSVGPSRTWPYCACTGGGRQLCRSRSLAMNGSGGSRTPLRLPHVPRITLQCRSSPGHRR